MEESFIHLEKLKFFKVISLLILLNKIKDKNIISICLTIKKKIFYKDKIVLVC